MCAGGHEGVIAKRADRPYVGDRTTTWLKIKCTKRQEFVIGGWRPERRWPWHVVPHPGTFEGGKFIYRGRVGTGFSDAMRDKIQMEARRIEKPAFATVPREIVRKARWVCPELVAEVADAEITSDGSVRHASFQGMRRAVREDGAEPLCSQHEQGQAQETHVPGLPPQRPGQHGYLPVVDPRPRRRACAVPVTWEELEALDRANGFHIFAAAARAQGPDAWQGYFDIEQTLTEQMQAVVKR